MNMSPGVSWCPLACLVVTGCAAIHAKAGFVEAPESTNSSLGARHHNTATARMQATTAPSPRCKQTLNHHHHRHNQHHHQHTWSRLCVSRARRACMQNNSPHISMVLVPYCRSTHKVFASANSLDTPRRRVRSPPGCVCVCEAGLRLATLLSPKSCLAGMWDTTPTVYRVQVSPWRSQGLQRHSCEVCCAPRQQHQSGGEVVRVLADVFTGVALCAGAPLACNAGLACRPTARS